MFIVVGKSRTKNGRPRITYRKASKTEEQPTATPNQEIKTYF